MKYKVIVDFKNWNVRVRKDLHKRKHSFAPVSNIGYVHNQNFYATVFEGNEVTARQIAKTLDAIGKAV